MIRVCIYTYHKDFLVTWYTQIHPTERYVEQRLPRKNFPKNPAWKLPHNPKIDIYILFRQTFLPKLQKTPWKSARHQKMVVHHTPHTPALGGPSCSRRCLLLRRQRLLPPLRRAIACGVMGGARVKRTTNGWKGSDEGWNPMYHHIWRTGKSGDFWKMGRDKPDEEGEGCWQGGNDDPDWQTVILSQNLKEVPEVSGFFRKIIFVTRIQVQKLGNYRPYSLKGISYGLFANRNRSVVDVCCLVGSSWPRNCGST